MNQRIQNLEKITLETPRLLLDLPSYQDIPKIVEYASNPNISDNVLNLPHPYQERDAIFWVNMILEGRKTGDNYNFILRAKDDKTKSFVGGVGLKLNSRHNHAEMGYWIAEPFWNKGYMSEALEKVLEFGFENLYLHKIMAIHFTFNPASGKVMAKNGMIQEAHFKEHLKKGERYWDVIQYRLTQEEYKPLKK